MRNYFVILVFLIIHMGGVAQEKTVTGNVTDREGNALSGVTIINLETSQGTLTDTEGEYSMDATAGQIIRFSYIGFKTQEVRVGLEDTIDIIMEESVSVLDDVLIIGYGKKSRREVTDNIAKITTNDFVDIPIPEVFNRIAGKVAGVQIGNTNGKIEAGLEFRIRGQASISAGTDPLYVIDGIPLINTNESSNGAPTNPLISLSANEIESIDILKDASSAAIYGARGANGVVIITTKRGKPGKTKFNINFSNGVSEATNRLDMLNAKQYVELMLEAAARSPQGDLTSTVLAALDNISNNTWQQGTYDTDWQDYSLISGHVRDVDFSFSGGDEKTTFYFSGAYNDTKGIVDGNELDRLSARTSIRHNFTDRFTAGMTIGYSRTNIDRVPRDGSPLNPIQAVSLPPIAPAFLDGEPYAKLAVKPNYLLEDKYSFYNTQIRRVLGKVYGEYKVTDGLKLNSDFAYDLFSQTEDQYRGSKAPFQSTNGEALATNVDIENYIISNYVTFDKKFNHEHDLNIVVGMELNKGDRRATRARGIEFPSDEFQTVDAASVIFGYSDQSAFAFLSYFARASYVFSNKYLFKASLRRDGSSRFGKSNQFGFFPAFSAGWIVSEENFLQNSELLSFLKLRASWGKVGNAEIGNFASLGLFGSVFYDERPGIEPTQAGNPNLTWEESTQLDVAVEYGLLNNKITGEVAYYIKDTDGLLFSRPLAPSSGDPNGNGVTTNIGRIKSQGLEITLNTRNVETDNFSWSTNFNLGQNKSEVIELPKGEDVVGRFNILREGEPLNALYLLEYAGVDPDNGDALYYINSEDVNGNFSRATTNNPGEANRRVVGQPFPNWIGGLTNSFRYKNFDLSFTFQGEWGASVWDIDAAFSYSNNGNTFNNQTIDQLNRWQNPGDITNVPEARFRGGNGNAFSTRHLQDADFIRLRNAMLGYSLPKEVLREAGFDAIRIYVSGINLLTFTDFTGYDPGSTEDVVAFEASGVTAMSAPPARTYSLGVNISF